MSPTDRSTFRHGGQLAALLAVLILSAGMVGFPAQRRDAAPPAGLTVWQANGQWLGADGRITREPSCVLNLLHTGSETNDADVRAIVAEYKARFAQEAVLRVKGQACMSL